MTQQNDILIKRNNNYASLYEITNIINIMGKNQGSAVKGYDVFFKKITDPETKEQISPNRKIKSKVGSAAGIFIFIHFF